MKRGFAITDSPSAREEIRNRDDGTGSLIVSAMPGEASIDIFNNRLNRTQIARLMKNLTAWLNTGSLRVEEPKRKTKKRR